MDLSGKIVSLYKNIDQRQWGHVLALFDENVHYTRVESSGTIQCHGKEALRDFYQRIRNLQGVHAITEIKSEGSGVTVRGEFEGHQNDQPTTLTYQDNFTFNAQGLIATRYSVIEEG